MRPPRLSDSPLSPSSKHVVISLLRLRLPSFTHHTHIIVQGSILYTTTPSQHNNNNNKEQREVFCYDPHHKSRRAAERLSNLLCSGICNKKNILGETMMLRLLHFRRTITQQTTPNCSSSTVRNQYHHHRHHGGQFKFRFLSSTMFVLLWLALLLQFGWSESSTTHHTGSHDPMIELQVKQVTAVVTTTTKKKTVGGAATEPGPETLNIVDGTDTDTDEDEDGDDHGSNSNIKTKTNTAGTPPPESSESSESSNSLVVRYLDLYIWSRKSKNDDSLHPSYIFDLVVEGTCMTEDPDYSMKYWTVNDNDDENENKEENEEFSNNPTTTNNNNHNKSKTKTVCEHAYDITCESMVSPYDGPYEGPQCRTYYSNSIMTTSDDNSDTSSNSDIYIFEGYGYWKNYLLDDWCIESTNPMNDYQSALITYNVSYYHLNTTTENDDVNGGSGCAKGRNAYGYNELEYSYEKVYLNDMNICSSQQQPSVGGQISYCNPGNNFLYVEQYPTSSDCNNDDKESTTTTTTTTPSIDNINVNHNNKKQKFYNKKKIEKSFSSYSCMDQDLNRLKIETTNCAKPTIYCKSLIGIAPEIQFIPRGGTTTSNGGGDD